MIQQITNPTATHIEIVEERDGDRESFLNRLHDVLTRFQTQTFAWEGKMFKARLIKRTDHTVVKSVTEKYEFMINTYTTSSKTKVMLEYIFTPLVLDLTRSQFLGE